MLAHSCKVYETTPECPPDDFSVKVNLTVTLPGEMLAYTTKAGDVGSLNDNYLIHFTICAYIGDNIVTRYNVDVVDDNPERIYKLPVNIQLDATDYDLVVWADYKKRIDGSEDYEATDLRNVYARVDEHATPYREAFFAAKGIDLHDYQGEEDASVDITMNLEYACMEYRIIATDLQDFLKQSGISDMSKLRTKFDYGSANAVKFDARRGVVKDFVKEDAFALPLDIPENNTSEIVLGYDYVLVDAPASSMVVNMTITDDKSRVVAVITNLNVPYKRGYVTTVRLRFLTDDGVNASIDSDFDGDMDFDIEFQ
jgi:hypothetical protein